MNYQRKIRISLDNKAKTFQILPFPKEKQTEQLFPLKKEVVGANLRKIKRFLLLRAKINNLVRKTSIFSAPLLHFFGRNLRIHYQSKIVK